LGFLIQLQSFSGKENKIHFAEAKTLDSLERQLALEMLAPRMAHVERERQNTLAKQYEGKAWATKVQQY
jgi:hypothetical protein